MPTTTAPPPESNAAMPDAAAHAVPTRGDKPVEPAIFEKHSPGAQAVALPPLDVAQTPVPQELLGAAPDLPELSMPQVIRHYTHLSQKNFSIDGEFYPLGSCTMKHNPRLNEWAASLPGFASLHPLQDDEDAQGLLRLLHETRTFLERIAGLHEASLQPAAGAHGEFTALKVIRAFFKAQGQEQRTKTLAPDTAHGTNPASCAMCGADVIAVKTVDGCTDVEDLKRIIDREGPETIMAFMITNPNTAGLFDREIDRVADIVHDAGAKLYLDGANMNAILGKTRPGDFGADAMHYNTHKTFSTPHGCGGPGAGPIVVTEELAPFLPAPQVVKRDDGAFGLDFDRPRSIGRVRSFFGQIGVLIRCWTYIRACGPDGLEDVAELAVLSANYLAARLRDRYTVLNFAPEEGRYCAHEFLAVPEELLARGVTLNDIVKRLIDYGVHPPTMHWPVRNCLMIEPTESEPLRMLDHFVEAMRAIADEAQRDPETLKQAPHHAPTARVDVVQADRRPQVVYEP